jgi:hypothetical protein
MSPACQARIQLISDGVVASYIHDISMRHHAPRGRLSDSRSAAGL